jgi:hypothetical protein
MSVIITLWMSFTKCQIPSLSSWIIMTRYYGSPLTWLVIDMVGVYKHRIVQKNFKTFTIIQIFVSWVFITFPCAIQRLSHNVELTLITCPLKGLLRKQLVAYTLLNTYCDIEWISKGQIIWPIKFEITYSLQWV